MQVFYSDEHKKHRPRHEFLAGALVRAFDQPERINSIAKALRNADGFDIRDTSDHGLAPITAIHDEAYVDFLSRAFSDWTAAGFINSPMASNVAGAPNGPCPRHIEGQVGFYANACDTTIDNGTWEAAFASAQCAVSAAHAVAENSATTSFALCRPPGHHCEASRFGGYCYLNNAAIAAQYLRDQGAAKIGLLDIDFHHGNGTQAIFYDRPDVFYGSVHGDPALTYPFFSGYSGEDGQGKGSGSTLNLPLAPGTGSAEWLAAISKQVEAASNFGADALVISLGVDAHHDDPQSFFAVRTSAFDKAGRLVRSAALPTVVVMEGGYGIAALGPCVIAFLNALDGLAFE